MLGLHHRFIMQGSIIPEIYSLLIAFHTLPKMIVRTWCRILLPTIQMETTQTCSTN